MRTQKDKSLLTTTELRLLQACSDRHIQSDKELGVLFFISPLTVRVHFKSIEGKLEVHCRNGAVTRAQELGLITPPRPQDAKIPPTWYGLEDFSLVQLAREA